MPNRGCKNEPLSESVSVSSESDLDPMEVEVLSNGKFRAPRGSSKRVSKFGRQLKSRRETDFIPTELTRFITQQHNLDSATRRKTFQEAKTPRKLVIMLKSGSEKALSASPEPFSDVDSGRGSSIDFQPESFPPGTLVWARFHKNCWWPSIVTPETETKNKYTKPHRVLVTYLADKYRIGFIKPEDLLFFKAGNDLDLQGIPHVKNRLLFAEAVGEAILLYGLSSEERLLKISTGLAERKADQKRKAEATIRRSPKIPRKTPLLSSKPSSTSNLRRSDRVSHRPDFLVASTFKKPKPPSVPEAKAQKVQSWAPATDEELIREFLTFHSKPSLLHPEKMPTKGVCEICHTTDDLVACEGSCKRWYHQACVQQAKKGGKIKRRLRVGGSSEPSGSLLCLNCELGIEFCFNCNADVEGEMLVPCSFSDCPKKYHKSCLPENLECPLHSCQTCSSKDSKPRGSKKLIQCLMCPTAFHSSSVTCVLAGTEFLNDSFMVCPKHPSGVWKINGDWCFLCNDPDNGRKLICCDRCPVAVHLKCADLGEGKVPETFLCELCKSGEGILYNEVVWAKCGNFRFWPGITFFPGIVPKQVLAKQKHPGDICVRFFGTYDYFWAPAGRMFKYQPDDVASQGRNLQKKLEREFARAVEEAKRAHFLLNDASLVAKKPTRYIKISTNVAIPPARLESEYADVDNCSCQPSDPDPCGLTSYCINRELFQECDPETCPCKEACQNRQFRTHKSPKLAVKGTLGKGFGLFAGEPIKCGDFVIEYVGEVIDTNEYNKRLKAMKEKNASKFYFMTLGKNLLIDAGSKGNLARFINHSCEANCETQKWTVGRKMRIGIFASKHIGEGEEVTFDYKFEWTSSFGKGACMCGAPNCCGTFGF